MISVEIDNSSGFCGGVIRAISTAEEYLSGTGHRLFSLGAVVHNEEEMSRLAGLGLVTLEDENSLDSVPKDAAVLIRAHGVPPRIYESIAAAGLKAIDCTCPVVLKLQADIREAAGRLAPQNGSILIFGKIGHPEVLGLVGQVKDGVRVVETVEQLRKLLESGELRTDRPVELFSQTTMSPDAYNSLADELKAEMTASLTVHDTICSQVASRHRKLSEFAVSHDVLVFVSGRTSSNGRVLFDLCRTCNLRTYMISSPSDLRADWFAAGDRVGVCGATSTPKWLLEDVAAAIENLQ